MENQLQQFTNDEFGTLEILMIDKKPYFPATECAKILGYNQPEHAITRHCKGCTFHTLLTAGGVQTAKYIPEGDLYRLIIRSKLPSVERFEHFVFDEILPSIRMHGAYITSGTLEKMIQSPEFAIKVFQALQSEREKNTALQTHVAELAPKARYCDIILQSKTAIQTTLIAKDYGMSAIAFNKLLHELDIQYKMGDTWILYQEYASKGYTQSKTYTINEERSVMHTYWTQKGRLFLYETLRKADIFPMIEKVCNPCSSDN